MMAPFPALWDGEKNEPGSSNCLGQIVKKGGQRRIRVDSGGRTLELTVGVKYPLGYRQHGGYSASWKRW